MPPLELLALRVFFSSDGIHQVAAAIRGARLNRIIALTALDHA